MFLLYERSYMWVCGFLLPIEKGQFVTLSPLEVKFQIDILSVQVHIWKLDTCRLNILQAVMFSLPCLESSKQFHEKHTLSMLMYL